jgi:hypothetical protein
MTRTIAAVLAGIAAAAAFVLVGLGFAAVAIGAARRRRTSRVFPRRQHAVASAQAA